MSIQISETARKAVKQIEESWWNDSNRDGKFVQTAINEACKPLVDALEKIRLGTSQTTEHASLVAAKALEAHRMEHGP